MKLFGSCLLNCDGVQTFCRQNTSMMSEEDSFSVNFNSNEAKLPPFSFQIEN